MRKPCYLPLLLALLAGCHRDEVAPAASGYDALALAPGHWEWERTVLGFGPGQQPATVGYTRQLVFTPDGQVLIGHAGRVVGATAYQLSMGPLAGCGAGQPSLPHIAFDNEPGFTGSVRKAYTLDTRSVPARLHFRGDYACLDGGAYESFHWVAE